jgi:hypothetical protein
MQAVMANGLFASLLAILAVGGYLHPAGTSAH